MMNKKLILITIAIYSSIAGIILISSFIFKEESIKATIYPLEIEVNKPIYFSDSTSKAHTILWEFGNGKESGKCSGKYIYTNPGKYKVRITINNFKQKTFLITVLPIKTVIKIDSSVFIHSDRSGITGQNIHFKVIGSGIRWCEWYFSGSGNIESRNIETFHSFNKSGVYEILLLTNLNPKVPIRSTIWIEPSYKITENTVLKPVESSGGFGKKESIKANTFQVLLQKITSGNDFNILYSQLLTNYLCSNPKTPIVVNGSKTIDFYSFCQGLQLNENILIKKAEIVIRENTGCAEKILVEY